jgi:hypothetical protein
LKLRKFFVELDKNLKTNKVKVMIGKKLVENSFKQNDSSCEISFNNVAIINTGQIMSIKIS